MADCPFDFHMGGISEPSKWILTPARADLRKSNQRPPFTYHMNLDTNATDHILVRKTQTLSPDWQKDLVNRKDCIEHFIAESQVKQKDGTHEGPQFFLVCIGQRNS